MDIKIIVHIFANTILIQMKFPELMYLKQEL